MTLAPFRRGSTPTSFVERGKNGLAKPEQLATGTRDGTKFLRDDNTWAAASGGSGAPVGSAYVTIGNDATLTAERALAVTADLSLVDGGAGGNVTLGLAAAPVTDHGALTGLGDDDHAQYLLLAGRSGQTITGDGPLIITGTDTDPVLAIRKASAATTSPNTAYIEGTAGQDYIRFDTDTTGAKLGIYSAFGETFLQLCSSAAFAASGMWARIRGTSAPNSLNLDVADEITLSRPAGVVGGSTHLPFNLVGSILAVIGSATDAVGLRLRQSSGAPTANMAEFQDSASVVRAAITADGYLSSRRALLNGSTSGTCTIVPAAVTTNHTITMPANNAAGVWTNDGAGNTSWAAGGGGGITLDDALAAGALL